MSSSEGRAGGTIDAVWRQYGRTRERALLERLIVNYAPLVKYVAGRLGARLPPHVDNEDLVQWGLEGLMGAIERFDPAREIRFETFAMSHIRGKMIDELRRLDFAPRSVRARAREIERAMQTLEARTGQPPTDEAVAQAVGLDVEEYRTALQDIARANVAALDESWPLGTGEGDAVSLLDTIEDERATSPEAELDLADRRDALRRAVERLPERERLVVRLYYDEELTLREIGQVLRVTESRVSQLHTKALLRLRGHLASALAG